MTGLDRPFYLDVVVKDDIVDVCVDERRTLANRVPTLSGDRLFFFCQDSRVRFEDIDLRPLAGE